MRTTASLCWNFLLFLWAYLNSSVQKMCLSYELQVPENYTALSGDLEVTIIDLLRTASEDVRLELLEVELVPSGSKTLKKRQANGTRNGALIKFIDTRNFTHSQNLSALPQDDKTDFESLSRVLESGEEIPHIKVERKWTVLGSVVVPVNDSNGGKFVRVEFPCGVITRGGHFGVRLMGYNKQTNNLTRRHRNFKFSKLDTKIAEIDSNLSVVGLDVRWPHSVLSIYPHHVETYPDVTVTAFVEFSPTKCAPVKGAPMPETWVDLVFCGHSLIGCIDGNSTHKQYNRGSESFRFRDLEAGRLAQVDDLVLLRSTQPELQRALNGFDAVCAEAGIIIIMAKLEVMVETFKYLGIFFTSDGRGDVEISSPGRSTDATVGAVRDEGGGLSREAKLSIFRSVYIPVLIYGQEIVYSEQIRGYPKKRVIALKCEFFGTAGHFGLSLRSSVLTGSVIETDSKDAFLKAVWSEHYIFNVHARSIFPCDVHGGGVSVLFQYPRCILKGDRVRLFSRLRAEVSSLVPPTTLHYVTEQRVIKGKHSLHFDCDFFSEKYVEYCFVYVSQAITGAVSDVRMDCVPTLPVYDSDSGGWGSWHEWSPCTTTCGGGTRNRFRYCDSPPPKYGAKFCEGSSVETERCGNSDWDCEFYQSYQSDWKGTDFPPNRPEIVAEVGPGCRCGCVIHLGVSKPRRLLATSSQSCPGRIFWQIEADSEHVIRFSVEHFRFPCGSQWLKVRDGDSRSSTLIGELSRSHSTSVPVISSGSKLLIEFFSDELLAGGQECWGGFLAHAQQTRRPFSNVTSITSGFSISNILRNMEVAPTASTSLFLVHCFVALFICIVILVSGCLGIQYVLRYRKYQLAAAAEDAESTGGDSQSSLVAVRSRATSNSTLLSEVISLQRFKPAKKYKHSRLKEDEPEMEEEHLSESSESQLEEKTPTSSLKTLKPDALDSLASTPGHSRKSLSPPPCCTPDESSDNQASQSFLKKTRRNETSSPETTGNSSMDSQKSVRKFLQRRRRSLSSSSTKSGSTLTGDCYSPVMSMRRSRTRNPKAKKEKRNLEKLLAGSEFSLPDDGDLELDYYDYDVQNASAVPNSYIGMDPAYLVWIPPFSPVDWDEEIDKTPNNEDEYIELEEKLSEETIHKWRENIDAEFSKCENTELNNDLISNTDCRGPECQNYKQDIAVEKPTARSRYEYLDSSEKETRVEKFPSEGSDYYRIMEDIKYADDEDDDLKIDLSKCDIYSMKTFEKDNHLKV